MLVKTIHLFERLRSAFKVARKCWRSGGVTEVKVSVVTQGEVLRGKRVLITGGSSGIGWAIAKKCLNEGATVVITGRDEAKLRAAAKELGSRNVHPLVWDVSVVSQNRMKLAEAELLADGCLDILVNNAGILGGGRQFFDLTEAKWDQISAVNMKGLVFLTQLVVKVWLGRGQRGKIINMSSMRGTLGVQDGPYGMSKWGLNGLTEGLGLKLAPHGILVNGIAPGIIATESIAIKGINIEENAFLREVPVSRIGLPEEVAELAIFLMSDAANYIVGQTIICDGGYTLKA